MIIDRQTEKQIDLQINRQTDDRSAMTKNKWAVILGNP